MTAVKANEVIEPGLFDPTIDGAKKLIVELNTTIDLFKTVLQVTKEQARSNPFANFHDVERATKDLQAADVAAKELAKSEKLLAEATNILANAQKGEIDLLTKNKLATQAANAETKRLAKEQLNLGNAYDQASAKLNNMRRSYKDAVLAGKEFDKGTRELLSDIHKLDAELKAIDADVGQFQRNVGNYGNAFASAFDRLNQELAGVKQQRGVIQGFGKDFIDVTAKEKILTDVTASLNREFKTTTQQSRAFQEAARKIGFAFGENSEIFKEFRNEVGQGVDAINDINDSIKLAASDTRSLDRMISAAQGIAGAYSVAEGATALFGEENEELQKTMVKLQASMTVLNGLQAVQAELKNKDSIATKGLAVAQRLYALAVGNSTGAMKGFKVALLATGIGAIIVALGLLIANFDKIKSVLGFGVNPATRELAEETEKAAEASQKAYEAFDLEERKLRALGTAELELIGLRRQATKERLEQAKTELEMQQRVLKEAIVARTKTIALGASTGPLGALFGTDEEEVKEIQDKYNDMVAFVEELSVKLIELDNKEGEELLKQRREIEDAQLAIMEEGLAKALAAEQLAHDRRREEAGENYELISLLEIQHQQNITKIRKEFNDKRIQEEFKYRELLVANMRDGFHKLVAEEQLQYDRRKKDLEGNYKALEQLAIQHEDNMAKIVKDRNKVPEAIEAKQNDVKEIVTKGNEDLKKAMEKAQEGITNFTIETANAQASALRQAQKEAERLVAVAEFLDDRAQKQADKRLKRIDDELDASKKRADELRMLAIQGDKNAQDSIAAEEKRQAILEQKKEKEAQKAKRRELLLTGINTYNSKVQAGDKNALGSTIRDLSLLAAALNALPGFIEGTEFVGANGEKPFFNTGKDDYLYRGHKGERILTAEQNARLYGMSNDLLASVGVMYKNGMLMTADEAPVMGVSGYGDTDLLASKLDEVNENLKRLPRDTTLFDSVTEAFVHTRKQGNRTEQTIYKL